MLKLGWLTPPLKLVVAPLALLICSVFLSTPVLGNFTHVYGNYLEKNKNSKGPEFRSAPSVRILVSKAKTGVSIIGTDLKRKFHLNNKTNTFKGRKRIRFNCKSLKKAEFSKPVLLASLGSSSGLITLEDEKYRGLLHVVSSKDSESCDIVHETDMDTYIAGLLSREMNATWPIEALKAQAVAARSYALHKMKTGQVSREAGHEVYYDLESSEKHQVSGNFFDVKQTTARAAKETSGEVLLDEVGKVSPIFFHAKCGGETLLPRQVWQNKVKSYKAVKCPFCHGHGGKGFVNTITMAKMKKFLKWAVRKDHLPKSLAKHIERPLRVVKDGKFKRKINFYLDDELVSFKKTLFRRYFGRFKFPSNNFKLNLITSRNKRYFKVAGEGLGHGVGMCQLGALDLAQKGWDYKKILSYYFPQHKLKKLY